MSDGKTNLTFDCLWCGGFQYKSVYAGAEVEVICTNCKKLVGIETNDMGKVKRIGTKVHVVKPVEMQIEQQLRSDNQPTISIGSLYGSLAVGGNATTTNIYNETIKAIDEAKGVSEQQKTQAKAVLENVKTVAAPFLPVIAEAIKKSLGL